MKHGQIDIARETSTLLAEFPAIRSLDSRVDHWREGGAPRYSACLDIRLDQSQLLVSGEARPEPADAVRAAFKEARQRLTGLMRRERGATGAARAA